MKSVKVWIRAVAGTTALAVTLGGTSGCGGSGTPSSSPKATATSASAPADAGASAEAGAGAAPVKSATATATPVLPDGRSAVYLTGLDVAGKTTTFDLIEFLTGAAAKAEWKKEHPDQPDGPDNDYMIVNNNKKLRTLPVDPATKCVVLATLGGTDTKTITFAALPAFLKKRNEGFTITPPQISMLPFWLTVKNGKVTHFEEQFLP
ncbi:hypothetical protein ODJ79_24785 [Actinoplanes sp. KI2]|uniref:hypothetical protein n=1 Tax=Actinoplanes sp. KI2 TaxID=2983315 RepID=UPI0021D5C8C6|nr:hypothetical protein [Actinoplanes sp. KI2]MCU7726956.1 hypothetical protein [Actinoplanes sp. KI2]